MSGERVDGGTWRVLVGDCRESMQTLPAASVQCCVTSPPYFGLRDYGHAGQIGMEQRPDCLGWAGGDAGCWADDATCYACSLVDVFREVRRVLRDDGTLWLNVGDSYAGSWGGRGRGDGTNAPRADLEEKHGTDAPARRGFADIGVKPKDLIGIPWRLAFALQADGWYLRSDIIWHKPNPMPESVTDRPTKAHEYLFLLSKSPTYYYDAEAIAEDATTNGVPNGAVKSPHGQGFAAGRSGRVQRNRAEQLFREKGLTDAHRVAIRAVGMADAGKALHTMTGAGRNTAETQRLADEAKAALGGYFREFVSGDTRNARTVWTIPTQPYSGAHFATFPPELAERCIKAGSKPGDVVLDPFAGSGTTGMVATGHGRSAILCELNPEYIPLIRERCGPMLEGAA